MSRGSFRFPNRVYPIVDTATLGARPPVEFAARLLAAGARLLQLRAKNLSSRDALDLARALQRLAAAHGARLIVDDRADVARLAGAAGVHLGQSDLPPDDARRLLGTVALIGLSTHDAEQVRAADQLASVDYVGFGPIFATSSKARPDPCQGLAGLREARTWTTLPVVAIGGIDRQNAPAVLEAGADAVAMIGALVADPEGVVRALG